MKRIILTGEPGCDKSRLAKLITQGVKTLEVSSWNMTDELKRMDPDTKWILIDGISSNSSATIALKKLIEADFIRTRMPYARTTRDVPVPNLLIVTQSEMPRNILRDKFPDFEVFTISLR